LCTQQLRHILAGLERGDLKIGAEPVGVEPFFQRLERLVNRIVLGVIVAAFINGLAVLMSVYHPSGWTPWIGIFFTVGFGLAAGIGVYLAWSIFRARHR
jgi:hypothetical protein